jgi:predicted transcriptional regulator
MDAPGPLELKCLQAIWTLGEANVHDVLEILETDRKLAYTTVMTTLDRLEKKSALARKKSGKAFVYTALLTESDIRMLAVEQFVQDYFGGSRQQLLAYLQGAPSAERQQQQPLPSHRLDPSLL